MSHIRTDSGRRNAWLGKKPLQVLAYIDDVLPGGIPSEKRAEAESRMRGYHIRLLEYVRIVQNDLGGGASVIWASHRQSCLFDILPLSTLTIAQHGAHMCVFSFYRFLLPGLVLLLVRFGHWEKGSDSMSANVARLRLMCSNALG